MVPYSLFTVLDFIGMIAFSISGAIAAVRKEMDVYGVFTLATVTAIGGGTVRDFLIGNVPVAVLVDPWILIAPGLAVIATFFAWRLVENKVQTLFLMDAIGIGMFTISGVSAGLAIGIPLHGCLLLGVITSTAGGITRDVLAGEIPLVLRKDIYASASLLGGLLYWLGLVKLHLNPTLAAVICTSIVIVVRVLSYRRRWNLPYPHQRTRSES